MRNPGHAHPMRPEYVLAPGGVAVDGLPQALMGWMRGDGPHYDI